MLCRFTVDFIWDDFKVRILCEEIRNPFRGKVEETNFTLDLVVVFQKAYGLDVFFNGAVEFEETGVFARLWFGDSLGKGESGESAAGEVAGFEDYRVIGDGELVAFQNEAKLFPVDGSDDRFVTEDKSDGFAQGLANVIG
jgi:hypothetical protein